MVAVQHDRAAVPASAGRPVASGMRPGADAVDDVAAVGAAASAAGAVVGARRRCC